ncbi:hypothetical protein HU675_0016175 [Bradyrhizobium septentrionale]|uniref:hypothetical protein n=1 Tax=Bradyrhizobium septentrionale TaxID=1404411 RepID=UPI001596A6A4|nr:hypothetical protein [Bradyrhizobium septentrionale]UGY28166.1 hypothetical protein HU675_0016175 [Bradyrhizobium septentrionale]
MQEMMVSQPMAERVHVKDISTFDEAFGTVGMRVGARIGPDKRTQDDKEWYVVRRFLKEALQANLFVTPLVVWKEQPPMPDFGVEFGDARALIEITEATHPDDQREMAEFERAGNSAMLLGEFGGRFSGGASEPGHAWASDIVDAIERKAGKSIYSMDAERRHLVIYPNSNASFLVAGEEDERRVFSILAHAIERRRPEFTSVANGCAIHVLETHLVCLDLLGNRQLLTRSETKNE